MGFENEVEQSIGRPCRQTNGRSSGHCELTSSIVPRGTSCHHEVELVFLLSDLIMYSSHAATAFLLQRNSAPSIQMRCMMTAKRRASATIAFFTAAAPGNLHRPGLEPSRSTRRTTSNGSTRTAKSGKFSINSLIRASNFTFPTIPTLRPKLRKVPRRSFSTAMAFDCSSLRWVRSILSF